MMKYSLLLSVTILIIITISITVQSTPLDDYISLPSPLYGYTELNNWTAGGSRGFVLNMTSVQWLTPGEVTCSYWWHYLVIIIPNYIDAGWPDSALMLIDGGGTYAGVPTYKNTDIKLFSDLAERLGTVAVIFKDIPNEPCLFAADPLQMNRKEDEIIAYAWNQFMQNPNRTEWLPRLPMVKSSILAMNTVTAVVNKATGGINNINRFFVAGASKRGWTTWLVGAVDQRVVGIGPIVMSELNFIKNIHHHYRAYGGWSFALKPYYDQNLTRQFDDPNLSLLMSIVDPYVYRDRLARIPICYYGTSGDEFFLPDDSLYWNSNWPGELHLRMFPNCEHELGTCIFDLIASLESYAISVFANDKRPQYSWSIMDVTGTITAKQTVGNPNYTTVKLWSATTLDGSKRDFRLVTRGTNGTGKPALHPVFWSSINIPLNSDGNSWTGDCDQPLIGWRGCFLEFNSAGRLGSTYEFTSDVSIVPQVFPFPQCTGQGCYGTLV